MGTYRIITTDGEKELDPADGYVLPHEHIIVDLRVWWDGEGSWNELDAPGNDVVPERLYDVLHRPQGICRENLVLSDWYLAAKELSFARESGCQLVVDLSTVGLDPVPHLGSKAARLAGVYLTVGTGRYLNDALGSEERGRSVEELVEEWSLALEQGIDGCRVGIIGEIGTGQEIVPEERRSLLAAAQVQKKSGLGINVHVHPYARRGLEALAILDRAGADLSKVALSHLDAEIDVVWLKQILATGCYAEFDLFGTGPFWQIGDRGFSSDEQRMAAVAELCEAGYSEQLLLSHDICMKNSLRRYGGWGYGHLGERVFPVLEERLGKGMLWRLTRINPLEFLAIQH